MSTSAVTQTTHVFQYAYSADSDLLASLTETNSEFTISRTYEDHRDLLTQIKTEIPDGGGGTNVVSQYDYVYEAYIYDSIGLRSSVVNDGTAFGTNAEHNIWGYNDRAELTSSYRYVGPNPSTTTNEVTAERRSYVYDPIGNRRYAYVGTSASPNPAYTANNLNQYTSTTNPDEELFDYDEDGNMTEDGTFEYTWNGENRLIQVEPSTATTNDLRLTFSYPVIPPGRRETGLRDHPPSPRWLRRTGLGRRVQKVEEEYDGSSWSTNAVTKFVWDGWLLIADPTSPSVASKDWRLDGMDFDALSRTHTWGLDLSGTFTGAGGISGLLLVDDDTGDGFCGYYPVIPPDGGETGLRAHDVSPAGGGMGQVLDAEDLSTDAHYEYDPYGLEIVSSGTYADDNPWRFSTKWLDVVDANDADVALLYYGYRYLSPRLGRWMSRDPSGSIGGVNPAAFVSNNGVGIVDLLGLSPPTGPDWAVDRGKGLVARMSAAHRSRRAMAGLLRTRQQGFGIGLPSPPPDPDTFTKAIYRYYNACCGPPAKRYTPRQHTCLDICEPFYSGVWDKLIVPCVADCQACKLGTFLGSNPPKNRPKGQSTLGLR